MAAKSYLKATTYTDTWGEIKSLVNKMQDVADELKRKKGTLSQMALDGDTALMNHLGFDNTEDAIAVKDDLISACNELEATQFYQRVLQRMG